MKERWKSLLFTRVSWIHCSPGSALSQRSLVNNSATAFSVDCYSCSIKCQVALYQIGQKQFILKIPSSRLYFQRHELHWDLITNAQHTLLISVFLTQTLLPSVIYSLCLPSVIRSWIGVLSGHSSFQCSPPMSPYPHPSHPNHWSWHINKINTQA